MMREATVRDHAREEARGVERFSLLRQNLQNH